MSMCQLNHVQKARQDQGKCGKCGDPIKAGDYYRWWKGRYTPKRVRCGKPGCTPQPWERETNPLRQDAMQGEDAASKTESAETPEEAAGYLREAIGFAEGLAEQLSERVDSWSGTNLENSSQAEACGYSKEAFEEWVSNMESVADDLEAMDPEPDLDEFDGDESGYEMAQEKWQGDLEDILTRVEPFPDLDLGA